MAEKKHAGGRPRKGSLEFRGKTWHARLTVTVEGESLRKWFDLGTDNKAVARRKLAKLVQAQHAGKAPSEMAQEATRVNTFRDDAESILARQKAGGLRTWRERAQRVRDYAMPMLERLRSENVKASHIREVLDSARDLGKSRQTIKHLRNDLSGIFDDLWRDELIPENPVLRVRLPEGAKVDGRSRVVLTDQEFARFMASDSVKPELHVMALTSRAFGGMRTSDLHAWRWEHVDVVGWYDAHVPRPKTSKSVKAKKPGRLELPAMLVPVLQAWWHQSQRPLTGAVFPQRAGRNAGKPKEKRSYAEDLRAALWEAGIVRPLEGFEAARDAWHVLREVPGVDPKDVRLAEGYAKRRCLIQSGSDEFKALDFHSFRRAFNTALAAAGVNVQQAMALAGHRSASTHVGYVELAQWGPLQTPFAALPVLPQFVDETHVPRNETTRKAAGERTLKSGSLCQP
jgi:integrase